MNKIITLVAIHLCCWRIVHAQAPADSALQVRHALFVHAGGAEVGVGPGYELQLAKPGGFILGCALGLPLLHSTWHRYYSPISLSPAINLMYGRRAWKMELAAEYNYFLEWGLNAFGDRRAYVVQSFACMGGLRRQLPWTGLIFRANFGVKLLDSGARAELLPAATVSLGYMLGSKKVEQSALPPRPTFHVGHDVGPAYSGGRKTLQLQVAPMLGFGFEQPWPSVTYLGNLSYIVTCKYQFQTTWAARAGAILDLGNADAIAGLRIGADVGLRQVRMDWQCRSFFPYPNGYLQVYPEEEAHIDDLQLTLRVQASLRLRTLQPDPWVFQIGAFTGDTHDLRRNSWYSYQNTYNHQQITPNSARYGIGPLMSISKQFSFGSHAIEPFLSGQCNIHRHFPGTRLNQWSTSVGAMLWL